MKNEEEWRDIPDQAGLYQASSEGRIRNANTGLVLKPWLAGLGYQYVGLGRQFRSTVHRLVCLAFHGPAPTDRPHVAHFDGERLNNRASNLRWASRSENLADSIRHGTVKLNQYRRDGYKPNYQRHIPPRGELSPWAKLTNTKAAEIRNRYKWHTVTMAQLAQEYGVGKSTIFRVLKGVSWGNDNGTTTAAPRLRHRPAHIPDVSAAPGI